MRLFTNISAIFNHQLNRISRNNFLRQILVTLNVIIFILTVIYFLYVNYQDKNFNRQVHFELFRETVHKLLFNQKIFPEDLVYYSQFNLNRTELFFRSVSYDSEPMDLLMKDILNDDTRSEQIREINYSNSSQS